VLSKRSFRSRFCLVQHNRKQPSSPPPPPSSCPHKLARTYRLTCVAQVEYWQTQASQLQQQLADAGDIQSQLQELRLMQQRDATLELGALTEPGTVAEHVMMLKRQQQVASPFSCHAT
jgi:hypothetical protein